MAQIQYPEYDSPFEITLVDRIVTDMSKSIDEQCVKAVINAGVTVDKDKLLAALNQDHSRYIEAYQKGYHSGYGQRDMEIVRCKNCLHGKPIRLSNDKTVIECNREFFMDPTIHEQEWFCAGGKEQGDDS